MTIQDSVNAILAAETPDIARTLVQIFSLASIGEDPSDALMYLAQQLAPISVTITSPTDSDVVETDLAVRVTGTVNVAGTVVVKLGATVLGSATMSGLDWYYFWTPQTADIGAQTLNATAAAAVEGSVADAPGVSISVEQG